MLERADVYALDVGELTDPERRAFAAIARMLDPAERHARVGADVFVDEAQARVELLGGDPTAAVDVAGEHPRAEAEFAGIRDPDGVGFVLGGDDRGDRPEHFLVMG